MNTIITDMTTGTEYKNQIINALCKYVCTYMNISNITLTAHHYQTLAVIKRSHRTFNENVRSNIFADKTYWDVRIQYFTYICYRCCVTPPVE